MSMMATLALVVALLVSPVETASARHWVKAIRVSMPTLKEAVLLLDILLDELHIGACGSHSPHDNYHRLSQMLRKR